MSQQRQCGWGNPVALALILHRLAWGDYLARSATWVPLRQGLARYCNALRSHAVRVDEFDLPAMGFAGNSHLVLTDSNSDLVAELIQAWIVCQNLMR